ncbi:site-specific DNA-methyltransferase [Clostridium perfringens]|nr:site-specific DNA-methyltransferase [Clostridium perfringens]MDM0814817.1 site-specific DNA-methyltransferase [Clostridium perfringens]
MDREKKKLDGKSFNIIEDNIKKLQELFPEIVTEGKVDIDKLALLFDKARNEDTEGKLDGEERYEFTWKGKKEAMRLAQKQSTGTLRPCREDSVNFDETQNLYIEGDNLEVLRALQNSYRGKVKMIYIDPPYNTGNDFIYKDDFKDNIANYKEKMNEAYKTNTNNDGRYHTNWLNMMYPRLKLARNLLKEDGVIFISIDDNEVDNLRKICDEIFGELNFISNVIWQHSIQGKGYGGKFSVQHNNILIYSKSNSFKLGYFKRSDEDNRHYSNPDNDPRGRWRSGDVRNSLYRPNLIYTIITPSGKKISPPENGWRWSEETMNEKIKAGEIIFSSDETRIIRKIYLSNQEGRVPETLFLGKDFGTTRTANSELKNIFGDKIPFDTPKPVTLIKKICELISSNNDFILDFFSGSATTAHAILESNLEDNKNNKFIMVQIPEETDEKSEAFKSGYKNICEIGKERIRRAGKKILEENKGKEGIEDLDIGFKVFKLDSTNLKAWDENLQSDKDMVEQLEDLQNPIKEGRTTEDLVYEIMLKYGVDLTMPIEELEILGSKVYSVGCGYLMICLEDNISLDLIEAIGNEKPNRVVLADKGLTTSDLINGEKILTELGVQDIRTI